MRQAVDAEGAASAKGLMLDAYGVQAMLSQPRTAAATAAALAAAANSPGGIDDSQQHDWGSRNLFLEVLVFGSPCFWKSLFLEVLVFGDSGSPCFWKSLFLKVLVFGSPCFWR